MEIEAKYRVSAEDLDSVASLRQLGDYALSPALAPEQQENTYYDTDDHRLTTARYGLRVRRVGARTLITLKGPAEVRADACIAVPSLSFLAVIQTRHTGRLASPAIWPWHSQVARLLLLKQQSSLNGTSST